jgi:hypothetical protein
MRTRVRLPRSTTARSSGASGDDATMSTGTPKSWAMNASWPRRSFDPKSWSNVSVTRSPSAPLGVITDCQVS